MNVCVIPARGGSKRIPRKNIRDFHGKPIIAYSIEAAKASGLFGGVVVSTDDPEIGAISQKLGAHILRRPAELSLDEVGTQDVMRHALSSPPFVVPKNGFEYACCIYPAAPMLTASDLRVGYALLSGSPYAYVPGLYYWGEAVAFLAGTPLSAGAEAPFPAERYIDINTEDDWQRAERMYMGLHNLTYDIP